MLKGFDDIAQKAIALSNKCKNYVSIAAAADEDTLRAVKMMSARGVAYPVLVGNKSDIERLCDKIELDLNDIHIVDEPDLSAVGKTAVGLVTCGEAGILMKGMLNTRDFLKAVLEHGLRGNRILSHLAILEVPGEGRMSFLTDGGMVVAPDFEAKEQILKNALHAVSAMGYNCPKVALLAANEQVVPSMPATVDAAALVGVWKRGELEIPCIVEGPIAMDVVFSKKAAVHKGIESRVAGCTDMVLVPNMETGNVLGKAMMHYSGARMAGFVLGAKAPVVLTSRNATGEEKFNSVALACLTVCK